MIRGVYTIRDEASGLYMTPTTNLTDEAAIRDFDFALKSNELMKFKPQDFSLWNIGDYDDVSGTIESYAPKCLKRGAKRDVKS